MRKFSLLASVIVYIILYYYFGFNDTSFIFALIVGFLTIMLSMNFSHAVRKEENSLWRNEVKLRFNRNAVTFFFTIGFILIGVSSIFLFVFEN